MHKIDGRSWKEFIQGGNKKKIKKIIDNRPPKVDILETDHQNRYEKELLNELFDYNRLIDDPLQGYPIEESCELSLNTSSDSSLDSSYASKQPSQDILYKAVQDYKDGVVMLKKGRQVDLVKDMIRDAARAGLPHAMFACAIITFKEVLESKTIEYTQETDPKELEMIIEAIEYLHGTHRYFFPLSSFVIGMMDLYNIGNYGGVIKDKSRKYWQIHFRHLLETKGTHFIDRIKNSEILNNYVCCPTAFVEPGEYMTTMGKERGMEDLEWIIRCVEYELVKDSILNPRSISAAMFLLEKMSSEDFTDAKCLHVFVLLKDVPDKLFPRTASKVYTLFREAVDLKHKDAKFFLGTLPFRESFRFLRENDGLRDGKYCLDCLREYANEKYNDSELKMKAATLVASEYLKYNSPFVVYSTEKAKSVLEDSGCSEIWKRVEKKLEERQRRSENNLYSVLKTLKKVYRILGQKNDSDAQQLSSITEQLFYALKRSRMFIQQSQDISFVLEYIKILLPKKKSLWILQYLCCVLEEEIDKQSDCSLKEEILPLLEDIERTCLNYNELDSKESNLDI